MKLSILSATIVVAFVHCAHQSPAHTPQTSSESAYKHTNKLIGETSPYLLEHAHNPVDWYPWGAEALERAKRENRPIFLSIGYSACHWCHVMERESFENEEIAKILNDNFVAIKVDREQRPDIDAQYMLAVQMMTGGGGWPTSVFLTPDRKPFFGGTYFPPDDFKKLITRVAEVYKTQTAQVRAQADRVASSLAAASTSSRGGKLTSDVMGQAVAGLERRYDTEQGGFSRRPKFPEAPSLAFLLARYRATGDSKLLAMVTNTLDHMAAGGIYDQIGGGFHRYSTDSLWRVPHFEKMLYDQAQLVPIYLEAWQITHKPRYRQVAEETLEFVSREMRDREGGFTSTIDADSEGEEGKFYLWTPNQVQTVLGEDAPLFEELFGITEKGDLDGKSVLHVAETVEQAAKKRGVAASDTIRRVDEMRAKLFAARAKRIRPRTDDKVLASWNGLMIAAYARAFQALGRPEYRQMAADAANFLQHKMTQNGALMHSYRAGKAQVPGLLEDYAFVGQGLLALYEATKEKVWLDRAEQTAEQMVARFWDSTSGGFYATASQGDLLTRLKSAEDEAIPSTNGVAAQVLARLASLTGKTTWRERGTQTVEAFGPVVTRVPAAFTTLLIAYQSLGAPTAPEQESVVTIRAVPASATVKPGGKLAIAFRVSVRKGWHVNAFQTGNQSLLPTNIVLAATKDAKLVNLKYPPGKTIQLGFSKQPLLVYEGEFTVDATLRIATSARPGPIQLRFTLAYQPCNDRACLMPAQIPAEVTLRVVK